MNARQRPLPLATPLSAPHWDACLRGILLVQRCRSCATYVFPPEPNCTTCLSDELAWVQTYGRGRLHSYSVVWRPQQPGFEVPYVVIVVALDEGWFMLSNLVGCDPADAHVGMAVSVVFEPVGDDVVLPMFEPASPLPA